MSLLPRLNYSDSDLGKLCQINYSDPISASGAGGGPIRELRQTKNRSVPRNILSAPYFPPSNRRNHRGRLET